MKTSDKLLLTLVLLILGVFGAINLTLYARMKAGHLKNIYSHDGWVRPYEGKAPSKIVVQGNINLTIVASDSFNIEVQEEAAGKIHCRLSGDSMIVRSDDTLPLNAHTSFQNYSDRPWASINITPRVGLVRVEGQLALFRGSPKPGNLHLDIQAINSQVWLGETYGMEGAVNPAYYYDSVHIEEVNSNLQIHQNAEIRGLSVHLDDQSEFNDLKGMSGRLHLQYAPGSKINIKGATLDKLKQ
ncbi:MAG TPA: hypothetical protein VHC96_03040 [Puia sp.]|jgi:hypothetical protein|nr:hypothetical protein [Puia sp.]